MPDQPPVHLVDRARSSSLSFAPPDPVMLGPRGRTPTRAPIAVGPGRAVIATPERVRAEPRGEVTYPIQPGKIQAPVLRDETLARTRLLDWLDVKIHSRVVFVIADAGYGKTTLLADFSRRTRLRTIWYRIEEDDRDWVGFLAHLVSAGREFDPEFAPRTASILRALEPGGPTREDAIETFLEELPSIAVDGAALIFDDFHLADEVADIRLIAREIVARAPERLTIVFASRRPPSVPVAKLRSLGELAELGITDLRFSDVEMEQLFRETYRRPLEPDVLTELAQRTEGWAASLTLVQAALRERTPNETRSFVRGLSGAHDELHDYLAEEVVGDLPAMQQQFLMRTSILQRVTPELAQVATGLTATEVQSMVTDAERLGMLGRRGNRRSTEQRFHPLVREFLEDRLRREIGDAGVEELHVTVAAWAEPSDWQTAAHHYAEAKRWTSLEEAIEKSVEKIVASGAFATAAELIALVPDSTQSIAFEIIRSRVASVIGDADETLRHAYRATELGPSSEIALSNLLNSTFLAGDLTTSTELAHRLESGAKSSVMRQIGTAMKRTLAASLEANITEQAAYLEALAQRNRADGHLHYEGVSLLNASLMFKAQGDADRVLTNASAAIDALLRSSSGSELVSAHFARAWALAWRGDIAESRSAFRQAGTDVRHALRAEYELELAEVEGELGDRDVAARAIGDFRSRPASPAFAEIIKASAAFLLTRDRNYAGARQELTEVDIAGPTPEPGRASRVKSLLAYLAVLEGAPDAQSKAREAVDFAERQGAYRHAQLAVLALASNERRLDTAVLVTPDRLRASISVGAELVIDSLDALGPEALEKVAAEAELRPDRWRGGLRQAIAMRTGRDPTRLAAAHLLDRVGDRSDVATLRRVAKEPRGAANDRLLGRGLARRLAPRVFVSDLGRVQISIGDTTLGGGSIRRKVLALLCLLLTRPAATATREEVMDSLWPNIDPDAATNSLNQTIYFLRRVFEPDYDEDTSPGYLRQESDLVFLDTELVQSASSICTSLIGRIQKDPSPDLVERLSLVYSGKFASDFAYEDWANDYRDWLHVAYLELLEKAITRDIAAGKFERGLLLARRALGLDPRLEAFGLSLLKLLKGAGAHSAAAEQYERYATLLREEIGIEPLPFDAL
jgi:ATP/maltotriose-dependent transcriptional regulator MalT/DNA-binding SARP family transcriptional activator